MSAPSATSAIRPLGAPVHYRINQIAAECGTEATVEMCESFLRTVRERSSGIVPPLWVGGAQTPPRAASGGSSPLCPGAPRRPIWNSPHVGASPPPVLDFEEVEAPPPLPRPASPAASGPAERVGDRVADAMAAEHMDPSAYASGNQHGSASVTVLEEQIRAALENFGDPDRNATANELLAQLQRMDPNHPRFCNLHAPYTFGLGCSALGYTRNSRGEYGMYAPPCNGCRIGQEELAADAEGSEPPAPLERTYTSWPPFLAGGAAAAASLPALEPSPSYVPEAGGEEEEVDAPPPLPTPATLPSPPRPMWRQGSVGEAGPFIGLSFGRSVLLVQRMVLNPGRDAFELLRELEAELREDEEPDLLAMPEETVIYGMARSYSWPRERTLEMLAGMRSRQQEPKTE